MKKYTHSHRTVGRTEKAGPLSSPHTSVAKMTVLAFRGDKPEPSERVRNVTAAVARTCEVSHPLFLRTYYKQFKISTIEEKTGQFSAQYGRATPAQRPSASLPRGQCRKRLLPFQTGPHLLPQQCHSWTWLPATEHVSPPWQLGVAWSPGSYQGSVSGSVV